MSSKHRKTLDKVVAKARGSDSLKAFAKLTEIVDGQVRIKRDPPLIVPVADLLPDAGREELVAQIKGLLNRYRRTLASDRRALLDQFEFVDLARKVVGVGSVGTRCWIVLLRGRDAGDPLFLQVKEAGPSVLKTQVPAAMRPRSAPRNEGERVVVGQRLMQAASDIFLGWERVQGIDGKERDFYVRQLRDMKGSAVVERQDPAVMTMYGQLCGWTLARAHARSGDPIALTAYLGADDAFPEAMAEYAESYADQNERDHAAFLDAIRSGRLQAESGLWDQLLARDAHLPSAGPTRPERSGRPCPASRRGRRRGSPRTGIAATGPPGSGPREAAASPYRAASGRALTPCARTLRNTVTAMTDTASSAPVPSSSSAISAKTRDARPRGPNQPTNSTVCRSRPAPSKASATGTIRTAVRLSTAYSKVVSLRSSNTIGTAIAPNASHTSRETRPLACSSRTSSAGPRRPAAAPKASPPANAATKPFPCSPSALA